MVAVLVVVLVGIVAYIHFETQSRNSSHLAQIVPRQAVIDEHFFDEEQKKSNPFEETQKLSNEADTQRLHEREETTKFAQVHPDWKAVVW